MQAERASQRLRVIVGAAIIACGRVLACERADPPEVAGMWEFPGGKVEPGETDVEALIRECDEELGVRVEVGERVGRDIPLGHGRAVLRVYAEAPAGLHDGHELGVGFSHWSAYAAGSVTHSIQKQVRCCGTGLASQPT